MLPMHAALEPGKSTVIFRWHIMVLMDGFILHIEQFWAYHHSIFKGEPVLGGNQFFYYTLLCKRLVHSVNLFTIHIY